MPGPARRGLALRGLVRRCDVWCGAARFGVVWQGYRLCGYGKVSKGGARPGMAW